MHEEKYPQLRNAVVVQEKTLDVPLVLCELRVQHSKLVKTFNAC